MLEQNYLNLFNPYLNNINMIELEITASPLTKELRKMQNVKPSRKERRAEERKEKKIKNKFRK